MELNIAGVPVTIRPIRRTDREMEADFIDHLSSESKRFRFLGGVRELSHSELTRLCDVDGKYSMAFVATESRSGHEVEIGVSRYAPEGESDVREIAVTVADEWQHKGLGCILMKLLVQSAKNYGVKHLYSVDSVDNSAMAALARDLGMCATRDPGDPHQVVYSLTL
jgi:RimJ/RimL family protein N-acetyltransferase